MSNYYGDEPQQGDVWCGESFDEIPLDGPQIWDDEEDDEDDQWPDEWDY